MVSALTSASTPEVPTSPLTPPVPPRVLSSTETAPVPPAEPPALSSVVAPLDVPVPEVDVPLLSVEVPVSVGGGGVPVSPVAAPVSPVDVPAPASEPAPAVPAPGSAVAVASGTDIDGFTDDEADDVLSSMSASAAALPVPAALADVSSPLLLASAVPSANELVSVVLSVVLTEPSEPASMWAEAEAEPSPADAAERSTVA